ncbi:MAG: hypothetical protein WCF68_20655 [Terriglobales bacterium]
MPGLPSFYFTLFKKFQVIDHVQDGTYHGAAGGGGTGFDLTDPNASAGVFSATPGVLAPGDTTPADSPLWAILNSKAVGNPDYSPVSIAAGPRAGSGPWPTMPPGTPQAWTDFQVTPSSNKLVDVFGDWISDGQKNDVPTTAIGTKPPAPIPGPLDSGVSLFVCSMPGDTGIRPGTVPSNYWATSLIFLTDQNTGATVFPTTLTAGSEYNLVAVIGNRGNTNGGIYLDTPGTGVEAAGIVMVWNTVDSPGVELPSLSNLDVTDTNPIYEQYFLNSAQYDVVGFRLNVQTVYDGIIAAINLAVTNGTLNLGGLTADQWVHAQPAHLCSKVVVREQGSAFPNFGDTPINNKALAQKNLAPFDINVQDDGVVPNIVWKNFVVGQPFFIKLPGAGANRLLIETQLPREAFQLYLGITQYAFDRFLKNEKCGGAIKGFKRLSCEELCASKFGNRAKPFPEAVVLRWENQTDAIELPALPEELYLGMSLGIEYNVKKIKPGNLGEINLIHRCMIPRFVPGTRCFEIEDTVAGGFTLVVRANDPFRGPNGKMYKF